MSKTLSHPIKAAQVVVLDFSDWVAKKNPNRQVHAAGCAHTAKAEGEPSRVWDGQEFTDHLLADDWLYVAPCARKA